MQDSFDLTTKDSPVLSEIRSDVKNRTRRTRETAAMRRMVRETSLSVDNLIYPMFVVEGEDIKSEISSMPGQYQLSVDRLVADCAEIAALDIPGVILFGIPDHKDDIASGAYAADGVVQNAVRALKEAYPELCVITDVCLCEYMDHGHCGIIEGEKVLNDPTLELLDRTAVSHAEAGADIIAPSDMMDGRIGTIRAALDAKAVSPRRPSWPIRRNSRAPSTGPSARRRRARPPSATGVPTRWTRPTRARRCAR